jgi:Predicted periplasmic protein
MQLNSDYYDTDFELSYKGNRILIKNDGPEGESLFVNGVKQDQNFSAHNGHLIGHIMDEENQREVIEVFLGGMTTGDCMVFAGGNMIHSYIPHKEPVEISEPVQENKRRRSSLFFPFLMILLVAVCMVFLMSHMKDTDTPKDPSNTVEQENNGSVTENEDVIRSGEPAETNTVDRGAGLCSADNRDREVEQEKYISKKYTWSYGKSTWTYELKIPESLYRYYKTVDRTQIRNYGYYVTDPSDDDYLAVLADKFREAAKSENYSDLDMVKNVIFFVQNLNYVDDKVGTGYDEYPKFPLETLADEGGDCEDSAILLASLLRELGYGTVLIQFKDHMAVGIKGDDTVHGSYYELDGNRYYYVETTSTGWDIGNVPEQLENQPAKILPLNR